MLKRLLSMVPFAITISEGASTSSLPTPILPARTYKRGDEGGGTRKDVGFEQKCRVCVGLKSQPYTGIRAIIVVISITYWPIIARV